MIAELKELMESLSDMESGHRRLAKSGDRKEYNEGKADAYQACNNTLANLIYPPQPNQQEGAANHALED